MLHHSLEHFDDIILLDKRHLAVDLCELGLTIGTKVLVAETLDDLEITVETSHHEKLLELLRRLRQSVELSGVHARGNHEVACALRRRFDEHRSFHLQEVLGIEITAHLKGQLVTKLQILANHGTTQIEITILHTQVITTIGLVLDGKWRNLRSRNHVQLLGHDLDITSRYILVFTFTFTYNADHLDNILTSQVCGFVTKSSIGLTLVKDELSDAITITYINECEAAHLTDALHPSCQGNLLANIGETKLATGLFTIHIVKG